MANNRPEVILVVSWTETGVGLFFFLLRFASNWLIVARWRWDFLVAAVTVAIQITAQIFLQLSVDHGMGRHVKSLSDEQLVLTLKYSWVFQLLSIVTSMLGKLAILAFLVQIRGRHDTKPWFLMILGFFIAAVNITVLGTILGQCTPMQKLWDDSIQGTCDPGRRMNQNYSFFQSSFNSFSDATLAAYPMILFWRLQMKLRIKIALSVLMGLGWIASVCSAVKTYELKALTETSDTTFAQPSLLVWASTESWIIVVVGCIPPIRPLMERIMQRLGLSSKKSSTPNYLYNASGPHAYGARSRTMNTNNSHFQPETYGRTKADVMGNDGLDWIELGTRKGDGGVGNAGGNKNGSKEAIVGGGNGVVITTDIVTEFEEAGESDGDTGEDFGGRISLNSTRRVV